jgi:hypothetical protein
MVIFHSYVSLPEGNGMQLPWEYPWFSWMNPIFGHTPMVYSYDISMHIMRIEREYHWEWISPKLR